MKAEDRLYKYVYFLEDRVIRDIYNIDGTFAGWDVSPYIVSKAGIDTVNSELLPACVFTLLEDYVKATLLYIRNNTIVCRRYPEVTQTLANFLESFLDSQGFLAVQHLCFPAFVPEFMTGNEAAVIEFNMFFKRCPNVKTIELKITDWEEEETADEREKRHFDMIIECENLVQVTLYGLKGDMEKYRFVGFLIQKWFTGRHGREIKVDSKCWFAEIQSKKLQPYRKGAHPAIFIELERTVFY
jgi:hypothetical protein